MKKIGLTGSIGMGKTETAKMFQEAGIPVFDSDAAVHALLGVGGAAVDIVSKKFLGVKKQNKIDRKLLGEKVFGDSLALGKLENILHPMVSDMRSDFVKAAHGDIVVFDIPLLFEKSYEGECDYIVVVSAPANVQKERVMSRPGMTEKKFKNILFSQMPDAKKREKAHFIIQTDKGFDYARAQVLQIIKEIRNDINARSGL